MDQSKKRMNNFLYQQQRAKEQAEAFNQSLNPPEVALDELDDIVALDQS
jgi:hypothetical protein